MKNYILTAAMVFTSSYTFASPAQSTILGDWNLASRACTSNTPLNDGIILGPDKISVRFNDDKSYELKRLIAGCETRIKGTYAIEGMKVVFTSVTSQSCKETTPQPMPEIYSMYAAYMNNQELILVATGSKAAACPASDALILNYERVRTTTR